MAGTQWTVKVEGIPEEGLKVRLSGAPPLFELERNDCSWRGPVAWAGILQRFGSDILCRGEVKARVVLSCSRCLGEVAIDLEVDSVFTFALEQPPDVESEELEPGSEESDVILYQDGYINLRDPVRDHLIMAIPLQPLCRKDCKGLCSNCGANLNQGPCGCDQERYDPRWEALARLRER